MKRRRVGAMQMQCRVQKPQLSCFVLVVTGWGGAIMVFIWLFFDLAV